MSRIELNKAFIELLTPNIVLVTTKDSAILEVEDIKEMKEINLELTKGVKYGVISDTGNYSSVSNEARQYMDTKGMEKNRIATAFIISSLSQRLLVNFFVKLNKPKVPTKSFSNMRDARVWMNFQINR